MKSFKTEIKPTSQQIYKIEQTFGNCRWAYNQYLAYNQQVYNTEKKFVSGYSYSKYLNNSDRPEWLKKTSSKATKQAIMNAEKAYKRFFKGQSKFPRFKKKGKNESFYLPKNNKTDLMVERHRIKVPTLGWVRLKEKGYIPMNTIPSSAVVSKKAGRYYVSVLFKEVQEKQDYSTVYSEPIGIDLGIKDLAILSNGKVYTNINKTQRVKKLEKQIKRLQRSLSRKYEMAKKNKNKQEGGATYRNINKNRIKTQKKYKQLSNIRNDYQNKVISEIVKTKPSSITVEKLRISNMMKNRHLSKAISEQSLYTFKEKLRNKCSEYNIELREVDTFYPSSKLCSFCGFKKINLSLSERTYHCDNCGFECDRDLNASINLSQAKEYTVLT